MSQVTSWHFIFQTFSGRFLSICPWNRINPDMPLCFKHQVLIQVGFSKFLVSSSDCSCPHALAGTQQFHANSEPAQSLKRLCHRTPLPWLATWKHWLFIVRINYLGQWFSTLAAHQIYPERLFFFKYSCLVSIPDQLNRYFGSKAQASVFVIRSPDDSMYGQKNTDLDNDSTLGCILEFSGDI